MEESAAERITRHPAQFYAEEGARSHPGSRSIFSIRQTAALAAFIFLFAVWSPHPATAAALGGACTTGETYASDIYGNNLICVASVWTANIYANAASGGNVGIGTTSPGTYKLNVNGTAKATGTLDLDNGALFTGIAGAEPVGAPTSSAVALGTGVSGTLAVGNGGTGATTLTAHGVVIGNGTSAVAITGAGTAGQVLTSNGASADPTFQAAGGVPSGFVGAFDLASCPSGWTAYAAPGRFIVGVGTLGSDTYTLAATGGEAQHTLTAAEMPSHTHAQLTMYGIAPQGAGPDGYNVNASGNIGTTGSTGGGGAHENRPPYVALLYCKKD